MIGKIIRFSRWLQNQKLTATAISSEVFGCYMSAKFRGRTNRQVDATAVKQFIEFVSSSGVVPHAMGQVKTSGPSEELKNEFAVFLRSHRGLASKSIDEYSLHVDRFLKAYFLSHASLCTLDGMQLIEYVASQASRVPRKAAGRLIKALRSFCKFLCFQGYTKSDLSTKIPKVANWSVTELPVSLTREQVRQLISSCDVSSGIGLRDYAILLLLARLGLRAREVSLVQLEDINWASGTIIIHGKGRKTAIMPLPSDVGRAVAKYLGKGRPKSNSRSLFLRTTAPLGGISVQGICSVVARALTRAQIKSTRRGAHILRHSLATEMLRGGAKLSEIAEMLRHEDLQSTIAYAKVDFENLRTLALPWPGDEK